MGNFLLYNKLNNKKYIPKKVCEIGVYKPEESNILLFIENNIPAILVEALPEYCLNIKIFFENKKNVNLIEAAIYDFNGEIELCHSDASTFVSDLESSPALINDNYKKNNTNTIKVRSVKFSEIDPGDIDLISIDIEGAEWYVLKHMVSRPNIISIETHGKFYTNPFINQIKDWMALNNYIIWYKDKSDSIYIRKDIFKVTIFDKIGLFVMNIKINLIKIKKFFKKKKS